MHSAERVSRTRARRQNLRPSRSHNLRDLEFRHPKWMRKKIYYRNDPIKYGLDPCVGRRRKVLLNWRRWRQMGGKPRGGRAGREGVERNI